MSNESCLGTKFDFLIRQVLKNMYRTFFYKSSLTGDSASMNEANQEVINCFGSSDWLRFLPQIWY